jgi:AAA+ superfamily predicted ATPase
MLHHIEIYVSDLDRSVAFWTPFLQQLGYEADPWDGGMNYVKEGHAYLCFLPAPAEHLAAGYHRKRVGGSDGRLGGGQRVLDALHIRVPVREWPGLLRALLRGPGSHQGRGRGTPLRRPRLTAPAMPKHPTPTHARRLTTPLTWDDLVLAPEVQAEIEGIAAWVRHGQEVLDDWGLARVLKPGYRVLFAGPPGTGKSLTAALIGQATGAEVFRVDLSAVTSHYIGETEKNLSRVFDQAREQSGILFFDEADGLFARRTDGGDPADRWNAAPTEPAASAFLQHLDTHTGLAIVASNRKGNIDDAFARRFQSVVIFPIPDAEQRLQLWRSMLRAPVPLADDVKLETLAERHALTGGAIADVVRHAAVAARAAGCKALSAADLDASLARTLRRQGRTAKQPA